LKAKTRQKLRKPVTEQMGKPKAKTKSERGGALIERKQLQLKADQQSNVTCFRVTFVLQPLLEKNVPTTCLSCHEHLNQELASALGAHSRSDKKNVQVTTRIVNGLKGTHQAILIRRGHRRFSKLKMARLASGPSCRNQRPQQLAQNF
jgi:hypothetical protein